MVAGDEEPGVVRLACAAMGTRFEFVLHGGDRRELLAAGEAAVDEVLLWHRRLSAFEASSVVSHIHRAGLEWCCVDAETFGLLALCREMWRATEGAFDPTVGRLMKAWGLRAGAYDGAEVEAARVLTGMDLVELDPERCGVRLRVDGVRLDLGAIGKGWALDRAVEVLVEAGVTSALLHAGTSSVRVIGRGAENEAWRVAVGPWPQVPVVELSDDGALGVSAPHGRRSGTPLGEIGHVMDPAMGAPVDAPCDPEKDDVLCAAVVARSAAVADALSTAFLVRPGLMSRLMATSEGALQVRAAMVATRRDGAVEWNVQDRDGVLRNNTGRECVHV